MKDSDHRGKKQLPGPIKAEEGREGHVRWLGKGQFKTL